MTAILFNKSIEKYTLQNGLEVILYPDYSVSTVSVNIWYRVGSANEKPGKTGFAHLFEHMMFHISASAHSSLHLSDYLISLELKHLAEIPFYQIPAIELFQDN